MTRATNSELGGGVNMVGRILSRLSRFQGTEVSAQGQAPVLSKV